MLKWFIENMNGEHQKKKQSIEDDEQYFKFMINDFNYRLRLTMMLSSIAGFVSGAFFVYVMLMY